jgi:hypothetical protein
MTMLGSRRFSVGYRFRARIGSMIILYMICGRSNESGTEFSLSLLLNYCSILPFAMAEGSKMKIYDRSLAGIAGSNSVGGVDVSVL